MSNKTFKRTDRVAGTIQRNLSELLHREVKDPRLPAFVTISAVKVTADLAHAKVYFTVYGEGVEETGKILNKMSNYLRSALAKSMKIRIVPQLHFVYDSSIEYGQKLSKLIDEANPEAPSSDESLMGNNDES